MRRFLGKIVICLVAILPSVILSELTGVDPVWYLIGLWLWKDLPETPGKEKSER